MENRQLFAAAVPLGSFSGSLLVGAQRHHVVASVTDASTNGQVSGTFRIDDIGRFRFTGNESNDVFTLLFTGAAGSGSLVTKVSDLTSGNARGEFTADIGGDTLTGTVRFGAANPTTTTAAAPILLASADNVSTQSGIAGSISGTVQFRGDTLPGDGRHRAHAVLHVDTLDTNGLMTGSFRMDHVGRYRFSGFVNTNGRASIVFSNGGGSGSAFVNLDLASLASGAATNNASATGKLFATINGTDVHGAVRLSNGSATLNGVPILTPPIERTSATTTGTGVTTSTTAGTPISIDTTGAGMNTGGTTNFGTGAGGIVDSINTGMGSGISTSTGTTGGGISFT